MDRLASTLQLLVEIRGYLFVGLSRGLDRYTYYHIIEPLRLI